jgi:hypothetical protein
MPESLWAVVRDGRIELTEAATLPEGAKLRVTVVESDERQFWLGASEAALDSIWGGSEDDVYAELLKR